MSSAPRSFARPLAITLSVICVFAFSACENVRSLDPATAERFDDQLTVTVHEQSLTAANYNEIVHSDTPALIDFSAAWCGPCQLLKPEVEAIAAKMDGELVVAIADMTDNHESPAAPIAVSWDVNAYPTLVLVKNGQELDRLVGPSPEELQPWIERSLAAASE